MVKKYCLEALHEKNKIEPLHEITDFMHEMLSACAMCTITLEIYLNNLYMHSPVFCCRNIGGRLVQLIHGIVGEILSSSRSRFVVSMHIDEHIHIYNPEMYVYMYE